MEKTLEILVSIIKEQKVMVSEIYEFKNDEYTHTDEVMKERKPKYSISATSGKWDEPIELTEKDFKEIRYLLNMDNAYVLPFNQNLSLLIMEYTFK